MRPDVLHETLHSAGNGSVFYTSAGILLILCSIYLSGTGSLVLPFVLSVSGGMLFGHSMGVDSVRAKFAYKIMEAEENG